MSGLWLKALEAAEDARLLLAARRFDAAANRAYYAMFNAARALLVMRGVKPEAMKRHATVQRRFSLEFVRNGPFDDADGHALRLASDARAVADYDDLQVVESRALAVVISMERFMQTAERTLKAFDQGG